MPGITELGGLTKTFGLTIGILLFVIFLLLYVVKVLYADNQSLHGTLKELLDQRGKYLDSILTEAISGKSSKRAG